MEFGEAVHAQFFKENSSVAPVEELRLQLLGRHQLDNAAAAIAAAHVVREQGLGNVTQDSVVSGLQNTTLPGRIQVQPSLISISWSAMDDLLTAPWQHHLRHFRCRT